MFPADDHEALCSGVLASVGADEHDLVVRVSHDDYSVVVLSAVVRETSPAAAIGRLNASLDRALITTGLFEAFDVTGRVLRAAPLESAERLYLAPPDRVRPPG